MKTVVYDGPAWMFVANSEIRRLDHVTISIDWGAKEEKPTPSYKRWASDQHISEARDIFEEYVCHSGFSTITD